MEKPVVTILCRTGGESQKRKFPLDYPPGIWYYIRCIQYAPVAQLDRASDSDSEGRAFEPHRAYQSRHGFHGGIFCVKQHQSPGVSWIAEQHAGFSGTLLESMPQATYRNTSSLRSFATDCLHRQLGGEADIFFPLTAPSEPVP